MDVSIFALSNRVLLHKAAERGLEGQTCFNIRSVESCTAAHGQRQGWHDHHMFQYSLCRIVYCCLRAPCGRVGVGVVSIFALSNRVLLPIVWLVLAVSLSCFNIRSVESCTAAKMVHSGYAPCLSFNIRSVESCTAATRPESSTIDPPWFQYSLCRIVYCCWPD